MTGFLAECAMVHGVHQNIRTFDPMKTKHHSLLAIACLGLIMTIPCPGASAAPDAKPVTPAPVSPAAKPLTQEGLIGAWVGTAELPKDKAGKEKVRTTIAIAFYRDGKFGLVLLDPADDIDPNGEQGLTYDYPLTGKWKLDGGVVTVTPDPDDHPEENPGGGQPFPLDLAQPEKDRLEFDLGCMVEPKNALGKNGKLTLRPATDQEVDKILGGKRPE